MQLTDIKDPAEKVILVFDFSPGLGAGETLTGTITVTVSTSIGTDDTPSAVLNGSAYFDAANKKIYQPVQNGTNYVNYTIKTICATTNPSKVLALTAEMPVRI